MSTSHASRGLAWEQDLESAHALYRRQGLFVESNPRRFKVLRAIPGGFLTVPEKASPPDFTALVSGLPPLLFDAKSATSDKAGRAPRWPLSKLESHQAAAFDTWERNGGRAFVLLRMDNHAGYPVGRWLLPWTSLSTPGLPRELRQRYGAWQLGGPAMARGDASYTVQDCDLHGIKLDSASWLPAARWMWGAA